MEKYGPNIMADKKEKGILFWKSKITIICEYCFVELNNIIIVCRF